jgi:hypothetical protein
MSKLACILLFTCCFAVNTNAQTISISGSVEDTINNKGVQNAVVALLKVKDSVLYKFTRTDNNGKYQFSNIKPGAYLVMTTHPYFADIIFNYDYKEGSTNIPAIALTSKSKLLEEVIVKTGSPIKIKGDTTIYTADSFKVRPGANVQELLKKLPGIQVDKDGKITAMGEQVKKVLVDGEEFFGDDPGIATKNLRADIVKEVEVFDKKSDQAVFTGIDDGVKDKTINLKLKDNAKKGYFGKAEAGTDLSKYYDNSIMANAFKGKRKFAGYGIMSNTGQTNLDWQDNQNYGGSSGMTTEIMDGGGMMITSEGDGDSYYNGRGGIPTNWNAGLHYSNKFNNGKQSLNTGYKYSKVNSPTEVRSFTTNFVGDSTFTSNKVSNNFSSKIKQNLNLVFETNIDSANSLKFTAKGNLNNTRSISNYDLESLNQKSLLINTSNRKTTGTTDNSSLNSTLLWKHKFKKIARTLTVNVNYNYSKSINDSYLYSENDYFINGNPYQSDTTDQESIKDNQANTFATNITYTEPLVKDFFMSLTYAFNSATTVNDWKSYTKDISGKYTNQVDSLTNSYLFKQSVHKPGISFRMVKKKYNYSAGLSISNSNFKQEDVTKGITRKYNFTNFFPTASFYKKLSGNGGVRLNYNGSTTAPTLNQLQPITDNSDPLYQYIGNPDLKQSFNHSFNANYNFYNVLQEKGMWSGIYGGFTQNAFVNESTIYYGGRTTSRTVNANGNYNFGLYSNYNFKWKKPDIRISFGPNVNISRSITYVKTEPLFEELKTVNTNSNYGINFRISKEKDKKYEISIDPTIMWVNAKNSTSSSASAQYWQIRLRADAEITFLKKFRFATDFNFNAKQLDPRFPAKNKFALWNASVKRFIFKEALEASVSVNDILNDNRGYDRTFNDYRYTETFYKTLQRFWMVKLTWNFSKNGKPTGDF